MSYQVKRMEPVRSAHIKCVEHWCGDAFEPGKRGKPSVGYLSHCGLILDVVSRKNTVKVRRYQITFDDRPGSLTRPTLEAAIAWCARAGITPDQKEVEECQRLSK